MGGVRTRILGCVRIDVSDDLHVREALQLLGPMLAGHMLPLAADTQDRWTASASLSTPADQPGGGGAHATARMSAHQDGTTMELVTWGVAKPADRGWWQDYTYECVGVLTEYWLDAWKGWPGMDLALLKQDMEDLASKLQMV